MKYEEWLQQWLSDFIKPSVKPQTHKRYSLIVRKHLIPKIGQYEIADLSPFVLQRYVSELLSGGNLKNGKGLAPNTINVVITIIQNSLRIAFSLGLISAYTADKMRRPKTIENKVECFSLKEQKRLEQAILFSKRDKLYGIILCLYTGLRIGEVIALQWSDIDFKRGILTVSRTAYDEKGGIVFDEPKTASSRRAIPLPKQLLPMLKGLQKRSDSLFVVSASGMPVSVRSYQRSFELLLKKLNIPHKGFHSLRHTFATRALECGMDVKTLSEILGHKNPTVTLKRYAHSLMEHKTAMMNRLGKLL